VSKIIAQYREEWFMRQASRKVSAWGPGFCSRSRGDEGIARNLPEAGKDGKAQESHFVEAAKYP
jgi:hypothetical protein